MIHFSVTIYTDGSCHTQLKLGAWAAIILHGVEKKILTGTATDTTHQCMELTAAIEAIKFVQFHYPVSTTINLISDSQYVTGLPGRMQKLKAAHFITKQDKQIQNADLVQELEKLLQTFSIHFEKIQAHLKKTSDKDYNIEVDRLCRKLVREKVK